MSQYKHNKAPLYLRLTQSISFYLRPVLATGYCRCLHLSVSPSVTKFVRVTTHHPFKLGSPNLDHKCKRPWLRSLLFFCFLTGEGDWPWPSRSDLTSKSKYTPCRACPCDNSSPVQARATKFGPKVLSTLVKIQSNLTCFQNPVYLHRFCVFEIFMRAAKTDENEVCSAS